MFFVFAAIGLSVLSVVVMSLWNWLLPPLFGARLVSFWQALGLLVLARVLFGRLGRGAGRGMHWRHRMAERWEQMTPEERQKFTEGVRGQCRRFGAARAASTT
jgi:hypothetical protein